MNINEILLSQIIETDSPLTIPKLISETFKVKNNYYVVTDGNVFNYYPIKVEVTPEDKPFFRLEKSAPVLLEGVAIIDKKVYAVPLSDLMRRLVRKSREINLEVVNGSFNTSSDATAADSTLPPSPDVAGTKAIQPIVKRRSNREIEVEIGEAADIAWQDQVRALLSVVSEEEGFGGEEWEITDAA